MEWQATGQSSASELLAQAPGQSSDTVADGRFFFHEMHGAFIIYIPIFLLMSVLSQNGCPFVFYITQFCSGTFSDSTPILAGRCQMMVWYGETQTKQNISIKPGVSVLEC